MPESSGGADVAVNGLTSLEAHASELYSDLRLMPMLRQLVKTSCRMAGAVGGSISIVDVDAGCYTKVAELGTACRLGQTFSLHEGVTGQVVNRREPVLLSSYREISRGHLAAGHPAWDGAVAAIPIWWRGEIVAVNVIFVGAERSFALREVDALELMTQVAAPGLVTAMDRDFPRRGAGRAKQVLPGSGSVEDVVLGLLDLAERTARDRGGASYDLQFTLVGGDPPRLLIRKEPDPADAPGPASGPDLWHELLDEPDGALAVQPVTQASLLINEPPASPFSAREQQVASLLARGLSDRSVAQELCLSPKTVEKHVGAVLRKTGTTSRTAAVVHCLEMGWL